MKVADLLDRMTANQDNKVVLYDLDSEAPCDEHEVQMAQRGWNYTPIVSSYGRFSHRHVSSIHVIGKKIMVMMYGVEEE